MTDSIWQRNGGVYVGYSSDSGEGPPPPLKDKNQLRYVGDRHVFWVGNNGTGKSRRLLLVNTVLLTDWSLIIIDPKGILARMTAKYRASKGSKVIIYDPYNQAGMGSVGFNQLQTLNPKSEDFVDDAMVRAEGIIQVGDTREPHWPQGNQELTSALSMYVRLVIPNGTYADVRRLMALPENQMRRLILAGDDTDPQKLKTWLSLPPDQRDPNYNPPFRYNGNLYPGMIAAGIIHNWEEIGDKVGRFSTIHGEDREGKSIISSGLVQTRWLDSRRIRKEITGPAFDFSTLKRTPTTVYLILPAKRLVNQGRWLSLNLTCAVEDLMKDLGGDVPVGIICDEAAALGHMAVFENNYALMREFGLKLFLVFQDLIQPSHIYKQRWETFIGNAGIFQSFAPQEMTTCRYISEMTGQRTAYSWSLTEGRSRTAGQMPNRSEGASINQIPMPALLPHQVRNMDDGYSVVFSNKIKGYAFSYAPYPTELPFMREIMKLDPSK